MPIPRAFILVALAASSVAVARAQTTAFTYQGHLMDGGSSANGNYDIQFTLKTALTGGSTVNTPQVIAPVNAVNGIFTVTLDFGSAPFDGSDRWVELAVRPSGSPNPYTVLSPRQKLTAAPYAVKAASSVSLTGTLTGANIPAGTITSSMIAPGTINPAVSVTGTSQTAVANTLYEANGSSLTDFILPANTFVGDTVVIVGSGSGGWATSAAWVPRESNSNWQSVASSADGAKLVAVVNGGQIYTSTDSGVSWTPRESNRDWRSVASSADGTKLVAVAEFDQIYTSTDSGVSWTPRESSRYWGAVASSADGTKLVATVVFGGQIYTSTDSGVSWTPRESNRNWQSVASSADGAKLVAVVNGGQIYTSTDSGVSWTPRESNRFWDSAASSADGAKLVAVVFGGQIYTSTDSGVNWTPRQSSRQWNSVASSADGTKLVAVVYGGQIYTSTDSGVNWMARESIRDWRSVASSADGARLVAAVANGQIYTNLSGAQGTSVTLQYLGVGQWGALGSAGSAATLTGAITADNIPQGLITGAMVANNAIGSTQLAANAVQSANIASGAVGTSQLASGLTLSGNTTLSGGNLILPVTTSSAGAIFQNGERLLHTHGSYNLFVGYKAGNFTVTGYQNTATGYIALGSNTTGNYNTAYGSGALFANTTGDQNTATGPGALLANTTGDFNTATGAGALGYNTTGSHNIALGYNAGHLLTNGSNNIAIGHDGVAGESGRIRLGTSGTHTETFLAGEVSLGVGDPLALLHLSSDGISPAASALETDDLIIGGLDAAIGLYSPNDGTYGAAFALKEINGDGTIANTWGLVRKTSGGGGDLLLTYGASDNYAANAAALTLKTGGDVSTAGNLTTGKFNILTPTTLNPTTASTLNPTTGYVKLAPASAVTLSATTAIASGASVGQQLILQGTSNTNTVQINDGAGTELGSNRILGASDTLTLIWDGTRWVETAYSNN